MALDGLTNDSGKLADRLVAQGRVVSASGRPIGGTRVVLYAWPVASVLSKVRLGQRVPVEWVVCG
jgi:hypothetical protein